MFVKYLKVLLFHYEYLIAPLIESKSLGGYMMSHFLRHSRGDNLFILAYWSFNGLRSFLVPFFPITPIPIMVISSSRLNLFISLGITLGFGKHIGRTSVCLYDRLNASESVIRAIS